MTKKNNNLSVVAQPGSYPAYKETKSKESFSIIQNYFKSFLVLNNSLL